MQKDKLPENIKINPDENFVAKLEAVMAKKYCWEIKEEITDLESGEPTGELKTHSVELTCSNLTGKAIIKINGVEFNISEKPFSLRGSEQIFKLGDMAALLSFPKKGEPTISIDNAVIPRK